MNQDFTNNNNNNNKAYKQRRRPSSSSSSSGECSYDPMNQSNNHLESTHRRSNNNNNHYSNRNSTRGGNVSSSSSKRNDSRRSNHYHPYVNSKSSTHQNHRHRHHHHPQQQHHPSDLPIIQQVVDESKSTLGPIRSVEGWILFVTGVHEEVQEDDIRDAFSEYGTVENISIQQDKRTGFCKGYALIEYREHSEAQDAINALHGTSLLGKTIHVDWAFVGGSASTTPVPTNDLNSGGGKSSSRNHYDRRRNR